MTVNPTPYHYHDAAIEVSNTFINPQFYTAEFEAVMLGEHEVKIRRCPTMWESDNPVIPLANINVSDISALSREAYYTLFRSDKCGAAPPFQVRRMPRYDQVNGEWVERPFYCTKDHIEMLRAQREQQIMEHEKNPVFMKGPWMVCEPPPSRRTFRQWFIDTFLP